jgi:hypothetical protein
MPEYNYAKFDLPTELVPFEYFPDFVNVGTGAPSFPLQDLSTGETVEMKNLWSKGYAIIEFGSFT